MRRYVPTGSKPSDRCSPSLAGFCYTQFTDTFQEVNGLFFEDRTPKFPIEAIRAATMGARRMPTAVEINAAGPVTD